MKILVGYDGSNSAMEALRLAKMHARAFDAKVYVVRSLVGGKEDPKDKIKQAESQLAFSEEYYQKADIACETHLLIRGVAPGEDIVKFAKDNGIDEIVIGIKRRSKVGKLLFGSNAQYVILKASCPVVTVR